MNETAKNLVPVYFNGSREAFLGEEEGLVQYDYGQILKFEDVELPSAYTVHFGNEKEDGLSKPMIGDENGVEIPAEFLQTGLPVWAWVFLHEGEDDGETEYIVKIPVKRRSRPTNYAPTEVQQSAIDQAIAALNQAVEDVEDAKEAAEAAQEAAEDAQEAAETAQGKAEDAQEAAETAQGKAETAEENTEAWAAGTRGGVPVSASDPAYHNNGAWYLSQTEAAETAALEHIDTAKTNAVGDVNSAKDTAVGAVNSAKDTAVGAVQGAQSTAVGAVNDAKNIAVGAVQTAQGTAVDAVNGDGSESAKSQAVAAVQQEGAIQIAAAEASAEDSEAWAVGTRDGEPVGPDDPTYQNNAKYIAEHIYVTLGVDDFFSKTSENPIQNQFLTPKLAVEDDDGKIYIVTRKVENGFLVEKFTEVTS